MVSQLGTALFSLDCDRNTDLIWAHKVTDEGLKRNALPLRLCNYIHLHNS